MGIGVALPRLSLQLKGAAGVLGKQKQQSPFLGIPERPTGRARHPRNRRYPCWGSFSAVGSLSGYLSLIMFRIRKLELFLFARLSTQG